MRTEQPSIAGFGPALCLTYWNPFLSSLSNLAGLQVALQNLLQLPQLLPCRLNITPLQAIGVPGHITIQILNRPLHESKDQVSIQITFLQSFDGGLNKPCYVLFASGEQDQVDQLTAIFSDTKGHYTVIRNIVSSIGQSRFRFPASLSFRVLRPFDCPVSIVFDEER